MLKSKILLVAIVVWSVTALPAQATPHPGQSTKVAVISGTDVTNGGAFPTTTSGSTGAFTDFSFTAVPVASVNATTLAAYDTVLLNVASTGVNCNVNTLSGAQKTDLVSFLNGGGKLIIYDSECAPQDYSWLPRPFTTSNPGALGGTGTVNIVEDNLLGTDTTGDPHFIDEVLLGQHTDAVGDMNVVTTQDPKICLHMSGTNAAQQSGAAHVYYQSGSGLLIYNGFDVDLLGLTTAPDASTAAGNLAKIWLQELQQPRDGTGLACAVAVVGISLTPQQATNAVGTSHTVTAKVTDQAGNPRPNVLVTFQVTGANAGASGTCNPASCRTDANGQVTFTYTGTTAGQDGITACFTPQGGGNAVCSSQATKTWTSVTPPPTADCDVESDGQITSAAGDAADFSVDVESGAPAMGDVRYRDRGPAAKFKLKSTQITSVTVSADGRQVTILGKATINGTGSVDFQADLKKGDGGPDTFRIRLSNGYDSGEQAIRGGEVEVDCEDENHNHEDEDHSRNNDSGT